MFAHPVAQFQTLSALFAKPVDQVGEQPVLFAQFAGQVEAHFAMFTQLAAPAGTQFAVFAADWDEQDSDTLLKLSSSARYVEASGNKIRGFVANLELYLQMCARPVHHWVTYCWLLST